VREFSLEPFFASGTLWLGYLYAWPEYIRLYRSMGSINGWRRIRICDDVCGLGLNGLYLSSIVLFGSWRWRGADDSASSCAFLRALKIFNWFNLRTVAGLLCILLVCFTTLHLCQTHQTLPQTRQIFVDLLQVIHNHYYFYLIHMVSVLLKLVHKAYIPYTTQL
jgi:hypothetical protein